MATHPASPNPKPRPPKASQLTSKKSIPLSLILDTYGPLIYDLCQSALWSKTTAQQAYRLIARDLRRHFRTSATVQLKTHQRAFVLGIALRRLEEFSSKHGRQLSSAEQIMLDSTLDQAGRLRFFESYLHRLGFLELIILLLVDKHQIPLKEVASAVQIPEDSLHLARQNTLRLLEEWLWTEV